MKKIALLIYPEFSIQEIGTLIYIFRWFYDIKTVTFSSTYHTVYSEEGIGVVPEKTFDEFRKEEYYCLILSGCSDFKEVFADQKIFTFLHSFKEEKEFLIGAICSSPLLLSMAGLLDNKKFTNSVPFNINESFSAINVHNFVYAPVVVDENIVTAVGDAFREFAIAIARQAGFACSDEAVSGISKHWKKEDFIYYLPEEELEELTHEVLPFFEQVYDKVKQKY